jgi:hypothetical protein
MMDMKKKDIILQMVLRWLNKESKIKDWIKIKWGRKVFIIKRLN